MGRSPRTAAPHRQSAEKSITSGGAHSANKRWPPLELMFSLHAEEHWRSQWHTRKVQADAGSMLRVTCAVQYRPARGWAADASPLGVKVLRFLRMTRLVLRTVLPLSIDSAVAGAKCRQAEDHQHRGGGFG